MLRIRPVPFAEMDDGMRALVRASDEALGGSEWLQAFAHAPDIFKPFARFYSTNCASIFPNRRFWSWAGGSRFLSAMGD